MPSNNHLARIHILKKEAGLDDEQYRTLLGGYGVASSKEFSNEDARRFENFLEDYINRNSGKGMPVPGWGKNKYEYLRGRRGDFADPKQLRKIEAMWRDIARNKSDEALEQFLRRQTDVKNITWLKKKHIEPVLIALRSMKRQLNEQKKDKQTTHG